MSEYRSRARFQNTYSDKRNKVLQFISNLFFLSVLSAIILFLTELIYFDNILKCSEWFWSYKWNTLYNMMLVFLVECIFYALTGNEILGFLLASACSYFIAVVCVLKYQARGEVLRFSDIRSFWEGISVMGEYSFNIPGTLFVALFLTLLLFFILYIRKKDRIYVPVLARIAIAAGLVCVIRVYYMTDQNWGIVNGDTTITVVSNFYDENGLMVGFLRTYSGDIEKPDDYSEKRINDILEELPETDGYEENSIQPDIIIVLMESLYDMSRIPGISFNKDPLAEFKELQNQYISGMMLTPVRGGGTCNAEYEVLTGYPVSNTPDIDLIYQSGIITKNPGSIVDLLKENDYSTLAIHANDSGFFSRSSVYPLLGFDETVFKENMTDYINEGAWISDASLYDRLIHEYENKDPKKKFFAFALTMQLHGGYDYDYSKYGIRYTGSALSSAQRAQLNTFANLEYGSVEALKKLLDYFSTVHHPVVVVAFGDHAPGTEAFGIEGETNPERGNEEFYTLQTTPFLVWNNFSESVENWGTVSSYKLGARVIEYCNIPLDDYFRYLLSDTIPEGSGMFFDNGNLLVHRYDLNDGFSAALDNLWLLQYDRMFGENYEDKK